MPSIFIAFLLVGAIIVVCLALVSVNNKQRKRNTAELNNLFNKLRQEYNLSFSSKETGEHFMIGLDERHRKLLALRKTENRYNSVVIDLGQIKTCVKKKIYKTVNAGTIKKPKAESFVEKIVLEFDYIDKQEPVQIAFYEAGADHLFDMNDLLRKAASWEIELTKTINTKLKSLPLIKPDGAA